MSKDFFWCWPTKNEKSDKNNWKINNLLVIRENIGERISSFNESVNKIELLIDLIKYWRLVADKVPYVKGKIESKSNSNNRTIYKLGKNIKSFDYNYTFLWLIDRRDIVASDSFLLELIMIGVTIVELISIIKTQLNANLLITCAKLCEMTAQCFEDNNFMSVLAIKTFLSEKKIENVKFNIVAYNYLKRMVRNFLDSLFVSDLTFITLKGIIIDKGYFGAACWLEKLEETEDKEEGCGKKYAMLALMAQAEDKPYHAFSYANKAIKLLNKEHSESIFYRRSVAIKTICQRYTDIKSKMSEIEQYIKEVESVAKEFKIIDFISK